MNTPSTPPAESFAAMHGSASLNLEPAAGSGESPVRSGVGGVLPLTEEECARLEEIFDRGAAKVETKDAYWIDGDDDGSDYCYECAQKEMVKKVARYRRLPKAAKAKHDRPSLGGGYSTEHDGPVHCEICGCTLEGSLTDYGCESELEHFTMYGFDPSSDDECYCLARMISARGWNEWPGATCEHEYKRESAREYFTGLHALGRKILGGGGAEQAGDGNRERQQGETLND